jgi:general L-amino acid transport system permease protein
MTIGLTLSQAKTGMARGRWSPGGWFYNTAVRACLFQSLISLLVLGAAVYFISNTMHNMEARGISSGFGFLTQRAGFGIIQSLIPFDDASTYGRTFLVGLANTLLVSALGILLATGLGFVLGVAQLSRNWLLSHLATLYVEIFRNIPLLLQLFFWYFAVLRTLPTPRQSLAFGQLIFLNIRGLYLPAPIAGSGLALVAGAVLLALLLIAGLIVWRRRCLCRLPLMPSAMLLLVGLPGLALCLTEAPLRLDVPHLVGFNFKGGMTIIPELAALLLALSIYTAAFIAEIVRSGLNAVNAGQQEAAQALGLGSVPTLRLVIIPQAMRLIIPPLTSQYLNLIKNSSLAAAIGYPDLVSVFMGTTLNQTGQAVEIIAMTMAVYLAISLFTSFLMNGYNRRTAMIGRGL